MEPKKVAAWGRILASDSRLWSWCTRLCRSLGWWRDDAVDVAMAGARSAIAEWKGNGGDVVPEWFVGQRVSWELGKMSRKIERSVRTRPLEDEDYDEIDSGKDEVFGPVADADEFAVLSKWCEGQGRGGDLLRRRLVEESAEELAAGYGMSVSQVRKILSAVSAVARERFSE